MRPQALILVVILKIKILFFWRKGNVLVNNRGDLEPRFR